MELKKSSSLSENDKSACWDNGYLFPINVFSKSESALMRSRLENFEKKWINNGLPLPSNTYKRVNCHLISSLAYEIASNYKILDKVEGILGPDILLWSAEFFIKEPMTKQIVGMHQDLTYWGMGEIDNLVTAWVALSPATKKSGCMNFVNGSHKNSILSHSDTQNKNNILSRAQEVNIKVRDIDKTSIVLETGQMSLHHGLMIHGSGPNSSSDRRIGMAIRYLNPKARQLVAKKDYAMVVKGVDRVGNFINVSPPSGDFTADSLAVYDEVRIAQAEAQTAGATNDVGLYSKE